MRYLKLGTQKQANHNRKNCRIELAESSLQIWAQNFLSLNPTKHKQFSSFFPDFLPDACVILETQQILSRTYFIHKTRMHIYPC